VSGNKNLSEEILYRNKFNSSYQIDDVRTLLFDKELTVDVIFFILFVYFILFHI
jgi:hypothetical protein